MLNPTFQFKAQSQSNIFAKVQQDLIKDGEAATILK